MARNGQSRIPRGHGHHQYFALKQNPLTQDHLGDFFEAYHLENRHLRHETA